MTVSALVKVWVMSLSGGAPVFDSSLWVVQNRLIPIRANANPGCIGTATFRMNKKTRADDNTGYATDTFAPALKQYIAITTNACTLPGNSGTIWVGYIDGISKTQLKSVADEVGTVTAKQLGGILDQIPVQNCKMFDPSGGTDPGLPLLNNPSANMAGQMQGEVIGNAIDAPASEQTGLSYTRRQFATLPSTCGTSNSNYWSRWALLDHVLHYILEVNPALPTITLSGSASMMTHLQAVIKEVIPLKGLTVRGLLDLLIGPSRGLYYAIEALTTGWQINIYSGTDVAYGTIPAVTPTNVTLQPGVSTDVDVKLNNSGGDQYDAVEVTGNPVICAGTVSLLDSTLAVGWSSNEETAYKDGASGAAGYSSLTQDQQIYRNRQVRKGGRLNDVYTRYILNVTSSQDFCCKDATGVPTGASAIKYLCPSIDWNSTTLTATPNYLISRSAYPPEARVCRTIPWPVGLSAGGTDDRSAEQKARPTYLAPLILSYNHPDVRLPTNGWANLCHPPFKNWPSPSISSDPRGPGIRIEYTHPEALAYTHWAGAAISELDPTLTTSYGTSNYEKLIVTLAIESDQRIKVIKYQSGFTSANVRNVLRINRPDLHCWFVPKYTFLGLKTDGTPDELAADSFVRNDWAVAEKLALEASAFAFRKRTGATITITAPDATPAWVALGVMIGNLVEKDSGGTTITTNTLNTYITNIELVFDANRARCIITTSDPPVPDSHMIAGTVTGYGSSPSAGGTVSTALGCTVPQSIQRVESDVKEIQRQVAAQPIIPGKNASGAIGAPIYGRVRWAWSYSAGIVDGCEAELCSSSGTANGTLVWINGADSLRRCNPGIFGDVWYILEPDPVNATATRGGTTRLLYSAVRMQGAGTYYHPYEYYTDSATNGDLGTLYRTGGNKIQTTINGSAGDNIVPVHSQAIASYHYDCRMPIRWGFDNTNITPVLIGDIYQTGRWRGGAVSTVYGSSPTTVSVSIDFGERFTIDILAGSSAGAAFSVNKIHAGMASGGCFLSIYKQDLSNFAITGFSYFNGVAIEINSTVSSSTQDHLTYTLDEATTCTTTGFSIATGGISGYSTSGIVNNIVTISFTETDGRVTGITFTDTVGTNSLSAIVRGGRPPWDPGY